MLRPLFAFVVIITTGFPLLSQAQTTASIDRVLTVVREPEPVRAGLMKWPARLDIVDAPLDVGLATLQERSGVPVAFSPSRVEGAGPVTCRCWDVTVGEALDRMLAGTSFKPVELGARILIERLPDLGTGNERSFLGASLADQMRPAVSRLQGDITRTLPIPSLRIGAVAGRVVAANTGRPLAGAQVQVPGPDLGTLTDPEGRFRIEGIPAGEATVTVLMLGYTQEERTVEIVSGETVTVDFQLRQQALGLDAIVVTGTPGEQQARSLGNTVGTIRAADLQRVAPQPDLESLLAGNVAGVNVDKGSGEIGSGANIRIRGAGSIALSSQPLVYIDGVRANNVGNEAIGGRVVGAHASAPPSRLNDLSPEDIESIEVIKGPAAATLYGTEASNGVINIITKQGAEGSPVFTLTTKVGQNWYPDPRKHWPTSHFRCLGLGTSCTPGEIVEFNVLQEDYERYGMDHFQVGMPHGYAGSVSGGTESLRYYFSLDWERDEGVVAYNWQNRLNGRSNLNWTPRDDLNVQFGLGIVRSEMRSASGSQPVTVAIHWSCPAPGCEEGSGLPNAVDAAFRGYIAYLPDVYNDHVFGTQEVDRTTFNITTNHHPFDWFSHRLIVGMDATNGLNDHLREHLRGGVGHSSPLGLRQTQSQRSRYLSFDYSGTATVEPRPGLALATSGGFQYYDRSEEWLFSQGSQFAVPSLTTVASATTRDTDDGFIENKTVGVYLQEQISWQNRLFLTAALRGDDNSAFGADFEFVVYPKVSASWVLSEESFLQDVDWLNSLRLRGAWGQAGQQPDVFAALRLYQPAEGFGGAGGLTPATIGNPGIEPEVGEEIELGFDAAVLDDRLGIGFTFYNQKRKNALINLPVRPSTGFPGTQFQNIGEVRNRGLEFELRWDAYRSAAADLHLAATIATNGNEITDMGGLGPMRLDGSNPTTGWARQRYVEGFPLGAIFLPRVVSADIENPGTAEARAINIMCEGGEVAWPGTNLTRGGGAPVPCSVAGAPEVFRGSPIPTREVGVNGTLTLYQNLQLFAHIDYVGGHYLIDGHAAGAHMFFRNTRAIHERTDPILLGYDALGVFGVNQPGLYDASLARLRRVSVSYTLPQDWFGDFGLDRATVTLSGQNLWTPWRAQEDAFGYKIVDPEQRQTNVTARDPGGLHAYQQNVWPTMKRFLATLRVTF